MPNRGPPLPLMEGELWVVAIGGDIVLVSERLQVEKLGCLPPSASAPPPREPRTILDFDEMHRESGPIRPLVSVVSLFPWAELREGVTRHGGMGLAHEAAWFVHSGGIAHGVATFVGWRLICPVQLWFWGIVHPMNFASSRPKEAHGGMAAASAIHLIRRGISANKLDFGFAILGSFFKRGYEPNVTTFTTLIKGLFLDDKVIEAEKLFKKLLALKLCEPNEVMILTVINGLCKAGHTLTAYDLLGLFEKTSFKPDLYSYNTVIDSLCKDRMVDEALQLLAKMIDKGISPNIVTYNSMLQGLCNFGRWKDAKDLITEMVDHKIPLNVITFGILVDAFCKEGMVKEAEDVVEIMMQRNMSPDVVMYTTLIDGYSLVGQINKARKLLDSMPGRFADGLKLFKDMQAEQVIPNLVTYNTLLHGLCMNKQIAEAFSFLHIMEEKGVNRDITTYNILIHGLCKDGKVEIARDVFNSLPCKGLQPDVQLYNIIIGSLCQEGHVEEAKCLLVEMEKSGCAPNSWTYNVCIQGVLRRKLLVEAKTFLDEMYRRGFSPDATSASMLLDHLQDVGLR
ncbi:UNVERIFIED_CONTAM: hypothetical protein Scaly_0819400 [Sesamum calycinum]|uniref:Pentatricopeptide repeat-containing protein n=1 Tax=Sesamum calycinum TaxID=2727403 RepID=A0AAW2RB94_9LAMI